MLSCQKSQIKSFFCHKLKYELEDYHIITLTDLQVASALYIISQFSVWL